MPGKTWGTTTNRLIFLSLRVNTLGMIEERDGRARRSAATRRKLMSAGARLFAARGYEGTSLDALTAAAGVNKALVRYHFGGKRGLYNAVFLEAVEAGVELIEAVRESRQPAPERLAEFVDAIGALFEQRRHFAPMVLREWMSGGAHVEPKVMAKFVQFFQVDREILESGSRHRQLRKVDPHSAHLALIGSLVFFQATRPLRKQRQDIPAASPEPGAYLAVVKDLFLNGLAR
jgi:TetR/AcrR family transcriptional regulator